MSHKRYPTHFKKQVVAESYLPGTTVTAVARRHGLRPNLVFLWRKDKRFMPDAPSTFLPVEIQANPESWRTEERPSVPVELELAGGHRLVFKEGLDTTTLIQLTRELRS